jgi:hypothetical protein
MDRRNFLFQSATVAGISIVPSTLWAAAAGDGKMMSDEAVDGATLEKIQHNIDLVRDQARSLLEKDIQFDHAAVAWLDGFIARMREKYDNYEGLSSTLGCFYGQCIKSTYGGNWRFFENALAIKFSSGSAAFPIAHVTKHFESEDNSDSILSKFEVLGTLIENGSIKVDKDPMT